MKEHQLFGERFPRDRLQNLTAVKTSLPVAVADGFDWLWSWALMEAFLGGPSPSLGYSRPQQEAIESLLPNVDVANILVVYRASISQKPIRLGNTAQAVAVANLLLLHGHLLAACVRAAQIMKAKVTSATPTSTEGLIVPAHCWAAYSLVASLRECWNAGRASVQSFAQTLKPSTLVSIGAVVGDTTHGTVCNLTQDIFWRLDKLEFDSGVKLLRADSLKVPELIGLWWKACSVMEGCLPDSSATRRALVSLSQEIRVTPEPFLPTRFQQRILDALEARAMTADDLVAELDTDRKRLYRDGLDELKAKGKVVNNRRAGGYYRPDSPPPCVSHAMDQHETVAPTIAPTVTKPKKV
jgi:hypothetical protein